MQYNQGASVVTVDEKEAGHLERVVIDPASNEITHLVIQQGLLQKKDKVVPIAAVTIGREGQLTVHIKSDELALLPDFEEEQYRLADEGGQGDVPVADNVRPPYRGGSPGFADYSPRYVEETHLNIPDNTVALKQGAKVIARENKVVGRVSRILTSTPTDRVTHFLIEKGLLVKEHRLIPVKWVNRLTDDEVNLTVDVSAVERLPVIDESRIR